MNLFSMWQIPHERISGDAGQLLERFRQAQRDGQSQGFVPVIFMETDSDMLESACEDALAEWETLEAFGAAVRAGASKTDIGSYRCDEWPKIQLDTDAGLFDDMSGGEAEDGFALEGAKRLFLLKVPVDEPWRIFEKLPFGGFGSCPENGVHMAFARHWHERYGAVPAILSDCSIQYLLPKPPQPDAALNDQLVNYCPSLTEYIHPREFAEQFAQVQVWFFFWD